MVSLQDIMKDYGLEGDAWIQRILETDPSGVAHTPQHIFFNSAAEAAIRARIEKWVSKIKVPISPAPSVTPALSFEYPRLHEEDTHHRA